MAKITALPTADLLTGEEHLPIVQGADTKRVTMHAFRALITPFLQNWYKGDQGLTGPANSTFPNVTRIRAAPASNRSYIFAPDETDDSGFPEATYVYRPGNVSGAAFADDFVSGLRVKLDAVDLTIGSLVRQGARGLAYGRRSVEARLDEVRSVIETGAIGDGATQNQLAFDATAEDMTEGGAIQIPAGLFRVRGQMIAPAHCNVHAFDYASIGDEDVIANSTFDGSPPVGWVTQNVSFNNPGLHHVAPSVASVRRLVTVEAYTSYLIDLTLATSIAGAVNFRVAGVPLLDVSSGVIPVSNEMTYQIVYFSNDTQGDVDVELFTDTAWEGTISRFRMRKVEQEFPYDAMSLPADSRAFKNPHGWKFGRHMAGNIFAGDRQTGALCGYKAVWNVAIGARALSSCVEGDENTAVGTFALERNTAPHNTGGGYSCLKNNTTGGYNTGWGYKVFGNNTTGGYLAGLGYFAGFYNTIGTQNTYAGYQAGYYNREGNINVAFGAQAGLTNDGGSENTYVGSYAGSLGNGAKRYRFNFTTSLGAETKAYGDRTLAVGFQARAGSDVDDVAGHTIQTTAVAIGANSVANADGSLAVGGFATVPLPSSQRATAVGAESTVTGPNGSAFGNLAEAGEEGLSAGAQAGRGLKGTGNVSLGYGAGNLDTPQTLDNTVNIGRGAKPNASNQINLGNDGHTAIRAAVTSITSLSDARYKRDITPLDIPDAFFDEVEIVTFFWTPDGMDPAQQVGVIAQQLDSLQVKYGLEWLGLVDKTNPDRWEATPGKLLFLSIAMLQRMARQVRDLEATYSRGRL